MIAAVETAALQVIQNARRFNDSETLWFPALHNIERWWSPPTLHALARLFAALRAVDETPVQDLLRVAFCRVVIQWSNAAFNHQSMSFKDSAQLSLNCAEDHAETIYHAFAQQVRAVLRGIHEPLLTSVEVRQQDSRQVPTEQRYDCVITSPPYPNRMSYIRELRPYMYWLGYLQEAREAGELDWQAVGGTWGIATSRLQNWQPEDDGFPLLTEITTAIHQHSPLLARYIRKYFEDIATHLRSLYDALLPGARLYYIIGNSKFYDTVVPVEQLYAALLAQYGYHSLHIETIRKRSSKKELFEYVVSCQK
ncbi:MAG: DNA methyltransferase [Chloroflexi bacterium]|nr:DNA methyltransferase [Chloroflexota bacterium]